MVSEKTEKYLWDTKFPSECEQLPLEYLGEHEQEIANKCINKEKLSNEEKKEIKKLLASFRPLFKEYDFDKIEENIEQTEKIIKTQSQLLEIIHDESRYRIDMNYWINGEKYLLQMRVKPYTTKQYLEVEKDQYGLFRDLKKDEKKLIAKAEAKQPMSPEEEKMHKALMDKLEKKAEDEDFLITTIDEFLADRIEFIGNPDATFEENILFWEEIELKTRISLFHEVRGRLQLTDTFQEDLFPAVR